MEGREEGGWGVLGGGKGERGRGEGESEARRVRWERADGTCEGGLGAEVLDDVLDLSGSSGTTGAGVREDGRGGRAGHLLSAGTVTGAGDGAGVGALGCRDQARGG